MLAGGMDEARGTEHGRILGIRRDTAFWVCPQYEQKSVVHLFQLNRFLFFNSFLISECCLLCLEDLAWIDDSVFFPVLILVKSLVSDWTTCSYTGARKYKKSLHYTPEWMWRGNI